MYNTAVIERFQNLQNAGILTNADAVGQVGSVSVGDIIKIYLRIDHDVITDAKFKTLGGVYALAVSDVVCDLLKGCNIENALSIRNVEINRTLNGLPENKLYLADLAQAVIVSAVDDYRKRSAKAKLNIKK